MDKRRRKNTATAFKRAFDNGFGVETDVRDVKGTIVISHNMPRGDEMVFDEFMQLLNGIVDKYCNIEKTLKTQYGIFNPECRFDADTLDCAFWKSIKTA